MAVKDYCIGSPVWNGLSKVIEEIGELGQVCGKIIGNEGETNYWGDLDLRDKFVEEIADLQAALDFFTEKNDLDRAAIMQRRAMKLQKFHIWNANPDIYAGFSRAVDQTSPAKKINYLDGLVHL